MILGSGEIGRGVSRCVSLSPGAGGDHEEAPTGDSQYSDLHGITLYLRIGKWLQTQPNVQSLTPTKA